jgi:glycosyltransferase involved in cell wall biosynthesis
MGNVILIVSAQSPEFYGPAGERIRHMALASGAVFGKALVLALQSNAKRVSEKVNSNVLLYEVTLRRELPFPITAYFDPMKFILLSVHSFALSLRYKPLYIVASMPPLEVGVSSWFVAKILGINLVVDLRDDWELAIERELSRYIPAKLLKLVFWIASKVYSFATAILVATQTIAERIKKRGIKTPTILASNGANTSTFFPRDEASRKKIRTKYNLPQNKTVVLYCGSGMNSYYRLDCVLSCIRSMPDDAKRRVFFVFYIFSGVESLRKMKEELAISDDVIEVRDPIPRVVLAEVMAACDVGLVPFKDDPYLLCARSTKLYEYLSAGLYVVGCGPKGGELDQLLSLNPQLGSFTLPYTKNVLGVLLQAVKNAAYIFDDNSRFLRHKFIQENYERKAIMTKAMRTLRSLSVSHRDKDSLR